MKVVSLAFLFVANMLNFKSVGSTKPSRTFQIGGNNVFEKDGGPFQILSGSIHYFRSQAEQWDDLLKKCRLGGLNTITTAIPWNLHQLKSEDKFNFDGNLDLLKFIKVAAENELLVILQVGPYIGADVDMGGLPAWLLWEKDGIQLRTIDPVFIYAVSRWFDNLLPRLKPLMYSKGGPIIMVQLESNYGSYDCDIDYISYLRDTVRKLLEDDVVLFTSDTASIKRSKSFNCSSTKDVFMSYSFGDTRDRGVAELTKAVKLGCETPPCDPKYISAFYIGEPLYWEHSPAWNSSTNIHKELCALLGYNASVNLHMYHGGTSFGFESGAVYHNKAGGLYRALQTSYDYSAPLNEAGDPTQKYLDLKETIRKHLPVPDENPPVSSKHAYGKVHLKKVTDIHDPAFLALFGGKQGVSNEPLSFEDLKLGSGFAYYETLLNGTVNDPAVLSVPDIRDRGYIYVNKGFQGIITREDNKTFLTIQIQDGDLLSILVENQGRISNSRKRNKSGPNLSESKGLGKNVSLDGYLIYNWTSIGWEHLTGKKLKNHDEDLENEPPSENENPSIDIKNSGGGNFYEGFIVLDANAPHLDTFLSLEGFMRGMVWVNDLNLGRYWPRVGPQVTLYVPKSVLKPYPHKNCIIILELERAPKDCYGPKSKKVQNCMVSLTDNHILNRTAPYDYKNEKFVDSAETGS